MDRRRKIVEIAPCAAGRRISSVSRPLSIDHDEEGLCRLKRTATIVGLDCHESADS